MSKHNCPLTQVLKKKAKEQLKLKISFKRVSCHSIIATWSSNELLKITPTPYIYFPDYDYLCRDYESDFLNFSKVISLTKDIDYNFYKCREGDSEYRNMMVIFSTSKYEQFYKNLQKLDKLKVFI